MFFKVTLRKIVTVQPEDLGPTVNRKLEGHLRDAVEGKTLPDIGMVLAVLDILNAHLLEGKVLDNGNVQFALTYVGLVYKLFEGEVLDIRVTEVRKDGFIGTTGPVNFYVSRRSMPSDYVYEGDGTLAVLVLKDGSKSVKIDGTTRIRIFTPIPSREGLVCGTMEDEYLGPR